MNLDRATEQSRPGLGTKAGAGPPPAFDPVLLELGEAGEDGDRLVFRKYHRRVLGFFQKKGASPDDAQDLTQETFLRVFRSSARLDNRAQLEAWLFEIARNVLINSRRNQAALKRSAKMVSLDEPRPDGEAQETADPEFEAGEKDALTSMITQEELTVLRRALSELPEQMRQCAQLRSMDYKYREIAEVMQISIDTVKSHLHQAKTRLRPLLDSYFGRVDW